MELRARDTFGELVATIDCRGRPGTLKGGGVGWFTAKEIQWFYEWKLRAQVSVTHQVAVQQRLAKAREVWFGEPADETTEEMYLPKGQQVATRPQATEYSSDQAAMSLLVERDVVELAFALPDSMNMMQHAFGCCDGGVVALSGRRFRVQALLFAKPPNINSHLRRNGRTLEFVRTHLGKETVVGRLENHRVRLGLIPIPSEVK